MAAFDEFGGAILAPRAADRDEFGGLIPGATPPSARFAKDTGDAILAGIQSSALGLAFRRKLPDIVMGEDTPWYARAAGGVAGVVADLPPSLPGVLAGGAIGTAVGGPFGGIVGGGAGAFAVPLAIREALTEAYTNNHATSWQGVMDIALAALKGAGKGAVIGGTTAGAGGVVARGVGAAIAPGVGTAMSVTGARAAITAAETGAELATLVTVGSAMEGHMPTGQDFLDNAILLGGMKGAVALAPKLRGIYAETGRRPEQVVADAQKDPALRAELVDGAAMPEAYRAVTVNERVQAAIGQDPRPELIREAVMGPDPAKPAAKPLAWEYVTSGEEAAALLRETVARYGAEVEAQRRGVVTNAQTLAEAEALLNSGAANRPRAIGGAANAAETVMRAALVRDAVRHSTEELAKLSTLRPEQLTPEAKLAALAAIERLAGVSAEYAGVRAEWGRAGQMMREMKYNADVLTQAETMVKAFERKMPLQEIAALARQLKDNPDALIEFSQGALRATTKEKIIEAWRASIFSGPLTWQANVLGNVGKLGVEMTLEAPISAAVYAAQQKIAGKPLAGVQVKARAFAPFYGLKLAALDGLHLVAETQKLIEAEGMRAAARKAGDAIAREDDRIDVIRRANDGLVGKAVGFSFGALKLQDMPFRKVAERAEAYIRAVDRAVAEKYDPRTQEFAVRVAQLVRDPTEGLTAKAAADVLKQIEQVGAEGVFAQRLGPRMEQMSGAMSGTAWEFVFPARRTPVNLLDWAVQHVPGGNFISSRWKADWAAGGERRADAIARQAVGAVLAATAFGLVESGMLTGGELMEKEEGRTKSAAGWQPYSVKVDGKYYSIARIEPVAKLFQLVGDMAEIYESPKTTDEDRAKALAMTVLAFGNATVSTTYMSGLANLMRAVLDPARYMDTFIEQYASSVVPKIVGQPVVMADEYKREVDGIVEAIQAQTPFLREKLLPLRDVWGEKVKNERLFNIVPVAQTTETTDKVRSEAVRLQLAISDVPRDVVEKGPFSPSERKVRLDAMQRDILREVSGKQAMEILTPIVNSPDWKKIPDFAQAAIYRKVIETSRKAGMLQALPPDDAARVQMRQKIVDEIIRQQTAADAPAPAPERRVR